MQYSLIVPPTRLSMMCIVPTGWSGYVSGVAVGSFVPVKEAAAGWYMVVVALVDSMQAAAKQLSLTLPACLSARLRLPAWHSTPA